MDSFIGLLVTVSVLSLLAGCDDKACRDSRASSLTQVYGVKVECQRDMCRARLSEADANRLASGLPSNESSLKCEVSSLPDAKSSSGAITDPCCKAGGSACTAFYQYVVSESGRMLCIGI